jgi:hypothetical protein
MMKIGTFAHAVNTSAPNRPNGYTVRIIAVRETRKSNINPHGILYRGMRQDGMEYDLEPDQVVECDSQGWS